MKVALVLEHFDPARGGAETSTREVAIELARHGASVTLVTRTPASPPGPGLQAALTDDLPIRLQALPIAARGKAAAARQFVEAADDFCRAGAFDIVHAMTPCRSATVYQPRGGLYPDAIAGSLAMVRSPLVRSLRGWARRFNARQQFLRRLEQEILSRAQPPVVACVSTMVAQHVRARYPALGARHVRVVFNGTSIVPPGDDAPALRRACRNALGIDERTPLVLFLAHNFKLKGLESLVRAAGLAEGPSMSTPWHVAVVGRGRAGRFQRLAARLGCALRFHFVGPGNARTWYAAGDVLALPTWYDPCSRVVLEAICCGLPVVTTRLNGAAEAIDPTCGVVIDSPDDVTGLRRAIDELCDPGRRAVARSVATERRGAYSMRRHAAELLELYRQLMPGRGISTRTADAHSE